jgi:hypothetical protein
MEKKIHLLLYSLALIMELPAIYRSGRIWPSDELYLDSFRQMHFENSVAAVSFV